MDYENGSFRFFIVLDLKYLEILYLEIYELEEK